MDQSTSSISRPAKVILFLAFTLGFFHLIHPEVRGQYADIGQDPLEWLQEPHSVHSGEISMSVKPLADHKAVEYKFECISGGGPESDWQRSNKFSVSGIKAQSDYQYIARVRSSETGDELVPAAPPVKVVTPRKTNTERTHFIPEIDEAFANGEIELIPIRVTGDKDNRINFCVINRWVEGRPNGYNSPELREEFIRDVKHAFRVFEPGDKYAIEPYPEYRDFFNLYAIWWPEMPAYDWRDGMSPADLDEIRDRLFLPWNIEGKGWVSCLAMVNSDGGGGGAARTIETRTGNAMIAGRETEAFIHEFSHTAPGLPDEYTSNGVWGNGSEGSNTDLDYVREKVKWKAWIEPGTEVPTPYSIENKDKIGVFEGTTHRLHHIYRSTARGCIMGAGSFSGDPDGLCPICVQRTVCRFNMWVNPFDSVFPARKEFKIDKPGTVHFAVDVIETENGSQKLTWYLNGRVISQGQKEVDIAFGKLAKYEVECKLVDESKFIRPDPPFVDYPETSVQWTVHNNQPVLSSNSLEIELDGSDPVSPDKNGTIQTTVEGGTPPYIFEWEDGVQTKNRKNLDPGTYKVTVYDAEYRKAEKEMVLSYPVHFAPEIISNRSNGKWQLEITGVDSRATECRWSDGVKAAKRSGLKDGFYSCTISDDNGHQITREIELKSTDKSLDAEIVEIIPPTGNRNNGSVSLNVEGGRKPYTFTWSDGTETDSPYRDFLSPGQYSVRIEDLNSSLVNLDFEIERADAFSVHDLEYEYAGDNKIKISNADDDYRYLWYTEPIPGYIPDFPNGKFYGTCTTGDGNVYKAEANIVENRGGVFIQDTSKNDFGSWIYLKIFSKGEDHPPVKFNLNTTQDGRYAKVLKINNEKTEKIEYNDNYHFATEEADITWNGTVEKGYLKLTEEGFLNSKLHLEYSSYYPDKKEPVATGVEFAPPKPGNYYVAAQSKETGAISGNRAGVAVTEQTNREEVKPVDPSEVTSSNLIFWLDANDLNADGQPDGKLFRRGSANGGHSKAGDIDLHWFNYFPNTQNGKPVASWKTIWVKSLGKQISNYQTIFMVRRENGFSSVSTAPWRELSSLIGTGEYGEKLFADDISSHTLNGKVRVNGKSIDPMSFSMSKKFYQVTYEFDEVLDIPFKTADGHWEGDVGEVLVFDSALSDNELKGVEEYLRKKWISEVEY